MPESQLGHSRSLAAIYAQQYIQYAEVIMQDHTSPLLQPWAHEHNAHFGNAPC